MCPPTFGAAMVFYWLWCRLNNQISVVKEPGASVIHARMRAALANLDEDDFTEGRELIASGECRRR
jgi:hypothetical protein